MIKFKELGPEKLVSQKLNNGDFDYYLVIETVDFLDATGELAKGNKYAVCIQVVSPNQVSKEKLESALDCVGYDETAHNKLNDLIKVEALSSYGVYAQVWSEAGNNLSKLVKEAKNQAQCVNGLFGFYMDKNVNRLGTTGWESVKGDLDSSLKRAAFSSDPGNRLVAKMSGYVAA